MTHRSGGILRAALVGLAAVAVLALAGCSSDAPASSGPSSTADPATAPHSTAGVVVAPEGFRAVTLVVTLPDGRTREWCLWLADTAELRARGLMGVTDPGLGGAVGMIFAFPGDTTAGFWMKDTVMPLSIAWYPTEGPRVSAADMAPCPAGTESCPVSAAGGPYRYAVEVPQGMLTGLGLVEGSSVALGDACRPEGSAL